MNFAERFEDLRIWQEARGQVRAIYRAFQRGSAATPTSGFGISFSEQQYRS